MLDSIWVMFTNVVLCSSVLSSTNDFDNVGTMICCTYYSGREPQCPVIVNYRNRLSCIEWSFPVQSWLAAVWVACSSNLSFSAASSGSLCLILCGTVVHRAH